MSERIFHRFAGFPPANSTITVPRLSEAEAKKLVAGCVLIEERGTTHRNYTIREYRAANGEHVYLGGDFTAW